VASSWLLFFSYRELLSSCSVPQPSTPTCAPFVT